MLVTIAMYSNVAELMTFILKLYQKGFLYISKKNTQMILFYGIICLRFIISAIEDVGSKPNPALNSYSHETLWMCTICQIWYDLNNRYASSIFDMYRRYFNLHKQCFTTSAYSCESANKWLAERILYHSKCCIEVCFSFLWIFHATNKWI